MTDDDLLEEVRVRRVLERYCRFLDDGNVAGVMELFQQSCTFEMMGRTFNGKDELAAVWEGVTPTTRPTTMHALSNPIITIDGDRATSMSNWTMFDRGGEGGATRVVLAGHYHDDLRRDDAGTWRFVARRAQALGRPRPPPNAEQPTDASA